MITEKQLEAFWSKVTVTKEGSIIGLVEGLESALSEQVQNVAVKSFIIEYVYDDNDVKTRTFAYDSEQAEAEAFCKDVKDKGGSVNIRIAAAPAAKQEGTP